MPERKFFRWLYTQSTGGISPIKEANCWDKFKRWLKELSVMSIDNKNT